MDYRKMVEDLFLAPARGWLAQAPKAPPSMGLLGDIHNAIDPVRAFGGYGGLAAMALPPGAGGKMPYSIARATRDSLEAELRAAGKKLDTYPKGEMNLTPDHVKQMPEWQADKAARDRAHEALRRFNQDFVKTYKNEIAAERRARGR